MLIIAVVFALAIAGMWARGENAGGDAQAYWAAVRIWLEGGDPYHPTGPFLPYVYAPWMLPLFIPWALLPWDVAWFVWRGATILLLLWSIRWAYTRRPLPTAILVLILAFPIAGNLDTGNINLLLALALFGAQFVGPKAGGLIWGLATWMKWVPALLWPVLPAEGARLGPRVPGAVRAAVAGDAAAHDRPAPGAVRLRRRGRPGVDYLVFIWAAVPWWWRHRDPFAFLRPSVVARGGGVPARSRAPLVGGVPRRPSGAATPRLAAAAGRCPTDRRARGPTAARPLRRRRDPGPRGGRPGRPRSWSGRRRRIRRAADRLPQGGAAQPPGAA